VSDFVYWCDAIQTSSEIITLTDLAIPASMDALSHFKQMRETDPAIEGLDEMDDWKDSVASVST
jgi:hypothetical protein